VISCFLKSTFEKGIAAAAKALRIESFKKSRRFMATSLLPARKS